MLYINLSSPFMQEKSFNLSRFRDTCSYCFIDMKEGLDVCDCGLSFCNVHVNLHKQKSDCHVLYTVVQGEEIEARSQVLNEKELDMLKSRLNTLLDCQGSEENIIFKDGEVDCPHLFEISLKKKINLGSLKSLRCSDCDITSHLYICFHCGFVGCGRVQYGIEGNGHAKAHYDETDHSVFVLSQSIKSSFLCDTFCYKCDDFVANNFCEKRLECSDFSEKKKSERKEDSESKSDASPFIGIKNAGNTCYVSSTIQILGHAVVSSDLDLEVHFQVCSEKNPLKCLFCQLFRIFIEMKKQKEEYGVRSVSIIDFLRIIWEEMPMFSKDHQHDAHEFLMIFISRISEGEGSHSIPGISRLFKFETENVKKCDTCKSKSVDFEENIIVMTSFKAKVKDSIKHFFGEDNNECICGGIFKISRRITRLPDFLLFSVGRYSYENNEGKKITENVEVEGINLKEYLKKGEVDKAILNKLKKEGFKEEEIKMTLIRNDNKEKESLEILNSNMKCTRFETYYDVIGAVMHSGASLNSGHYTFWGKYDEGCYLVNDRMTSEVDAEGLHSAYVVLFH